MDRPRIFVSAVSSELGTARRAVAATLRRLGYDPVSEDDFPTGHGELRRWLFQQIDASEGLIQLVGESYGTEPPVSDPAYGRVSYTQLEFLYASRQGKRTWVIVAGEGYPRDNRSEDLALPDSVRPEPGAYQAERHALQRSYVERLARENHLRHTVRTEAELERTVLRLRDDLEELRRVEQRRWRRLTALVAAIVVGLAVLGGGTWWGINLLRTDMEQIAVVDAPIIRARLVDSAGAAHRRELDEAEQAASWEERERLRASAATAHANRLARIDEVVASFREIIGTGAATDVFAEMQRVLRDEGVDKAIAYVDSKRGGILEREKRLAAAARARRRENLQPLLQAAALLDTKGEEVEARARYDEILEVDRDWPEALHRYLWFLVDQGDTARVRGSLGDAERDYAHAHRPAQRLMARDPANTRWQRDLSVSHERIGDVLVARGDGPGALAAYRQGLEIAEALATRDPENTRWQRDLSVSHVKVGDVLVAQGDGTGALSAYRKSLEIREALTARDPANARWQRDLSISHERIGEMLVAQGDGPGALAAYREGLEIREALVARDPANTEWQRDSSVSQIKIGDVLVAQGDGPGALAAYRKGLEIAEVLTARDPANTQWQYDLGISNERAGNVLLMQGDGFGALTAYRKRNAIIEALAARDPANTEWQRDLSVSHVKVGNVLVAQGDGPGALAAYRKSLEIREALAARDPANTEWQRDLSVSYNHIGKMLVAQGDWPGALAVYRKGHQIFEALAARDPANTRWQRDLSISHERIGDALVEQGDGLGALADYRRSLEIRKALAARDPANTRWQRDLSVSHDRIGDVLVAQGDGPGALAAYREGLEIAEALAVSDPANTEWQVDLALSYSRLGTLENALAAAERRYYLKQGRRILIELKSAGRLLPSQDWVEWFDARLSEIPSDQR